MAAAARRDVHGGDCCGARGTGFCGGALPPARVTRCAFSTSMPLRATRARERTGDFQRRRGADFH